MTAIVVAPHAGCRFVGHAIEYQVHIFLCTSWHIEMDKLSECDKQTNRIRHDAINARWGQLYNLQKEWSEKSFKYLFLTNSGGAVAMLSFIGASPSAIHTTSATFALALFTIGVILVGIAHALAYHFTSHIYAMWKRDSREYLSGQLGWDKLNEADDNRSEDRPIEFVVAYGAFGSFVLGCISAGFSLFG